MVNLQLRVGVGADTGKDFFGDYAMRFNSLLVLFKELSLFFVGLVTIQGAEGIVIVIFGTEVVEAQMALHTLANQVVVMTKGVNQVGFGLEDDHGLWGPTFSIHRKRCILIFKKVYNSFHFNLTA